MREIKYKVWYEFPEKYEVGTDGSIWSLKYNNSNERKELRQYHNEDGYKYVVLVVDGKRYKRLSHRMVAISFILNPENKPQVNHLNGIRNDNRTENLEWCTARENTIHGYRSNGRKASPKLKKSSKIRFSGTSNPKAKVDHKIVHGIREMRNNGILLKVISKKYNISVAQVSAIANNKYWKNEKI